MSSKYVKKIYQFNGLKESPAFLGRGFAIFFSFFATGISVLSHLFKGYCQYNTENTACQGMVKNKSPPSLRGTCFISRNSRFYFLGFLMLACAAARRAMGTLYGEQET